MKQTCILILGMHRSGTSALTGVLNLLDVYLGSDLMEGNSANQKGYFENNHFYQVNEKLLSMIDSSWDDVFFNDEKIKSIEKFDDLKSVIQKEFEFANIFAIKDPRLIYLFPIYKKVLESLQIDIKIILPYRNPVEVANSLNRRDSMSKEKGLLLWAYHFLLAEKHSRGYDRVFISFDELIQNTDSAIEKISQSLNLKLVSKYKKCKKKIEAFLEPGLKHHNISIDNLSEKIPNIIKNILALRENLNDESMEQKFDTLREELFSNQKLFYNHDIIGLLNQNKNLQTTLKTKEQELSKSLSRIIELQDEVEEKNQWAFSLNETISELEKSLRETKESVSKLQEDVQNKEEQEQSYLETISELEKSLRERMSRIVELQDEVEEKNQWAFGLNDRIKELEGISNTYHQILNSNGWKLLSKYYSIKELAMIIKNSLLHPFKLYKVTDKYSFHRVLHHIKQGNYAYVLERMGYYIKTESSKIELDLMEAAHVDEVLEFPVVKSPKVSIVIPVYNQFDYTYNCLRSILEHTEGIAYEIIIADDVSSDDTINIKHFVKNINIVRNKKNLGFLLNCNNAAKEARGEYIFFLNNDTNVQKDWLLTLLETIEKDKTIGMVGSKLVYADGRQQEAGGIIWNDASGWNFGRLDNPEKPEYNYVKEVDYISGAAIMIRKSLWDEIGGFDERYVPAYYEDSDLAFEVRKHGYKVVLQPKSVVVHFEGISNGTDTGSGIKKYQVVNNEKFFDKWKDVLEKEHFPNAQDVFLARDRSSKKKHVLFIDHYLPHYDQDAGSKATLQYLQILVSSGMQVHFIGDNFWHYPDTPYLDTLTNMGIEVLYGNWYANNWKEWLKENGKYLDYVILSRPHISVKYIDIVKDVSDAKIIYFGHDLHFLREEREYVIKKDKKYLKSSENWKRKELDLIKKADVAYYFSDVEQNVLKDYDSNLNIDVVPLYIYDKFKDINYVSKNRKDIMFVGGFGHGPNTDAMIWFINEVWPLIQKELSDIHFYIIGSKPPQEILSLESEFVTVTGFISDEELENYYNRCRLAVVPLRFGAGIKGKVIDALYNGLPLVATSIAVEGINNATEFISIEDNAEEFADTVCRLYGDEQKLNENSIKSLNYCKSYFSVDYAKSKMAPVFVEFEDLK